MSTEDSTRRKRLVVVGGGINGLAAAWKAWEISGSGPVDVVLFEASSQVGGKARTRREDGWIFEEGPTGFLGGEAALDELVKRSGLTPLAADHAAARRYVVRGGKAREIRLAPPQFAMSGIMSPMGLLRMAGEILQPPGGESEESVWEFAARRLGPEAADRLIAPMVLGIYAGDAKRLSLPAAFPKMAKLERDYGGLFRGMLAKAKLQTKGEAAGGPGGPGGALYSFADGLQSLPEALASQAPFRLRVNAAVESIERDVQGGLWQVRVKGASEAVSADSVILCTDAHTSARLLDPLSSAASEQLSAISMPGLAVVGLGFTTPNSFRGIPPGFGVLIPRGEGFRTLGCLFDTQLFPGRSPEGTMLVRCMIGGTTDPEAIGLDDNELLGIVIDDMRRLFRLKESPTQFEIARWPQAIPQYELGHLERVSAIDGAMDSLRLQLPGLHLAGCHARGVAFGKTAAEGWRVGELAARELLLA